MGETGVLGQVRWLVSERSDGDFCLDRVSPEDLSERQRALIDKPWTLVRQVHGIEAVEVVVPGSQGEYPADILATSQMDAVIGIWVGDCVPVLLISPRGRLVMAHVGWRGLAAGAVAKALQLLHEPLALPTAPVHTVAVLGPHIGPCCYEFSQSDLDAVALAIGVDPGAISPPHDRYATVLDMHAAISLCLRGEGITDVRHAPGPEPVCTGCDQRWFSHRVRSESERHVMAAWRSA